MNDQNNENLEELFEEFLEDGQVNEAIEDMLQGEQILREYPAPRPPATLVAGIKFKITAALLLRRARVFRYVGYVAAAAAVIMLMAIIGITIKQHDGAPRMVAQGINIPPAVWENDDSTAANAELLVLSAEIEEARQEMLALELGENGGNGRKDITELEMEYIEISSDFWKG